MTALGLFALAMGLVPDLDLVSALMRTDWAFQKAVSIHRASILHTPPFAFAAGLATLALPIRERGLWATVACAAVLTHLVLDSVTVGSGVMWLYPWSDTFYGLNLWNNYYGRKWGHAWLSGYLRHPLFLIEVALAAAATLSWQRRALVTTAEHRPHLDRESLVAKPLSNK